MGKQPIRTWPRMRKMIKDRFLPLNFVQVLWEQLHNCHQGTRSIHQYTTEYQRLQARTNLSETPYYQMIRYVNGLRNDIKERVEMFPMNTITYAISLAYKAEKQLQVLHRFSSQRPSRHYSLPTTFDPKTKPHTPNQSSTQNSHKDPPRTFSSPSN